MKLKALAAIAVAGIMVMSVPMVALAEDRTTLIQTSDCPIVVDGNLTVSGDAIYLNGGTTVIKGNVTSNCSGTNGVAIHTGNSGSCDVTVGGNVSSDSSSKSVIENSGGIIKVGGSVAGTTTNPVVDTTSEYYSNVETIISGDLTNNGDGYAAKVEEGATLVVEGTMDSYHKDYPTANVDNNAGTRLIVYEITNSKSENRKINGDGCVSNVYYIIKGTDSAGISNVEGTTDQKVLEGTSNEKTYKTAKLNDVITFSVTSGYELKEGTIEVIPNADGTYSVTVPVGGGVTLEAIKKAIEQAQSSGGGGATFTSTPTSQGSSSAPITSGSWAQASNGKFTYTNNGEKLINCTAWIQYTDANGQVVTGKYCFDNNGYALVNTWKEVQSGVWNYFGADGKMVTNTTTPDGYVVDANGEWRK